MFVFNIHLVKVCIAERRDYATVDLAKIKIHYGLAYDWIQSLPDCLGYSAQRSAEPSREAESLELSPGNVF